MTENNRSLALKLIAGVTVVGVVLLLRGIAPELVRYMRIRRM